MLNWQALIWMAGLAGRPQHQPVVMVGRQAQEVWTMVSRTRKAVAALVVRNAHAPFTMCGSQARKRRKARKRIRARTPGPKTVQRPVLKTSSPEVKQPTVHGSM